MKIDKKGASPVLQYAAVGFAPLIVKTSVFYFTHMFYFSVNIGLNPNQKNTAPPLGLTN